MSPHRFIISFSQTVFLMVLLLATAPSAQATTSTLSPGGVSSSISTRYSRISQIRQQISSLFIASQRYAVSGSCQKARESYTSATNLMTQYNVMQDSTAFNQATTALAKCYEATPVVDGTTDAGILAAEAIQYAQSGDCTNATQKMAKARSIMTKADSVSIMKKQVMSVVEAMKVVNKKCRENSTANGDAAVLALLVKAQASAKAGDCGGAENALGTVMNSAANSTSTAVQSAITATRTAISACYSQQNERTQLKQRVLAGFSAVQTIASSGACVEAQDRYYENLRLLANNLGTDTEVQNAAAAAKNAIATCQKQGLSNTLSQIKNAQNLAVAGECYAAEDGLAKVLSSSNLAGAATVDAIEVAIKSAREAISLCYSKQNEGSQLTQTIMAGLNGVKATATSGNCEIAKARYNTIMQTYANDIGVVADLRDAAAQANIAIAACLNMVGVVP